MRILLALSLILTTLSTSATEVCEASASRGARAVLVVLKAGHRTGDLSLAILRGFGASTEWYNPYTLTHRQVETLWYLQIFDKESHALSESDKAFVRAEITKYVEVKSKVENQVDEARIQTAKILYPRYMYQVTSPEVPQGSGSCYVTPVKIDGRPAFVGEYRHFNPDMTRPFIYRPFHRDPKRRLQILEPIENATAHPPKVFIKNGVPFATVMQQKLWINLREGKEIPAPISREVREGESESSLWTEVNGSPKRYNIRHDVGQGDFLFEFTDFTPGSKPKKITAAGGSLREHRIGSHHFLTVARYDGRDDDGRYRNSILIIDVKQGEIVDQVTFLRENEGRDNYSEAVLYKDKGDFHLNVPLGDTGQKVTTYDVNLRTKVGTQSPSELDQVITPRKLIHIDGRPYLYYRDQGFALLDLRSGKVERNRDVPDARSYPRLFSWKGKRYWLMGGGHELIIMEVDTRSIISRVRTSHFISQSYPFAFGDDVYALTSNSMEMPHLFRLTNEDTPR